MYSIVHGYKYTMTVKRICDANLCIVTCQIII